MPLHEVDPNLHRRGSKSSAISAKTTGDGARQPAGLASNSSAVQSMLRTGTETGDLGAFGITSGRFPKLPKPQTQHNRGVAPSRTSSTYSRHNSLHGSVRSAASQRSGRSGRSGRERPPIPGEWPHSYRPQHGRHDQSRYDFDARSSLAQESVRSMPISGHDQTDFSDRSYSLTQGPHPRGHLSMQRSITSLRSQPEAGPPRQNPRYPPGYPPGPRFPGHPGFAGYRPSSPALSDTAGAFSGRRPMMRPGSAPRSYTASPAPTPQGYRGLPRHDMYQQYRPNPSLEELRRPFAAGTPSRAAYGPREPAPDHRYASQRVGSTDLGASPRFNQTYANSYAARSEEAFEAPHTAARSGHSGISNSTAYGGFVQRVKNVLEERISSEQPTRPVAAASPIVHHLPAKPDHSRVQQEAVQDPVHNANFDLDHSYSATLEEEQPLEEDEVAEEERAEVQGEEGGDQEPDEHTVKRLTRDLIKAGMDGMSDVVPTSEVGQESNTGEIDYSIQQSARESLSGHEEPETDNNSEELENDDQIEHEAEVASSSTAATAGQSTVTSPAAAEPVQKENAPVNTSIARSTTRLSILSSSSSGGPNGHQSLLARVKARVRPDHGRPLSMPSEPSQEVETPTSKTNRFTLPPNSSSLALNPVPYEDLPKQQALNRTASAAPTPASSPPSEAAQRIEGPEFIGSTPSSRQSGTKVTILPSSPLGSSSSTLYEDTTVQERRARPSSLGTVTESEYEPLTTASVGNTESIEIASPRASLRNSGTTDSFRRASSPNDGPPSAFKNFRFPLPDLAEDSQEDASTTNLRMLGHRGAGFRGRGGFKDFRRTPRQPQAPPPITHRDLETTRSYFRKALRDTHNLPSFNFSRNDLTAKMNAALGIRSSRSVEDFSRHFRTDFQDTAPLLERPLSANTIRERYRSFFVLESDNTEEVEETAKPSFECTVTKSSSHEQEIISEIERLSIPSVKNLSLRLSELFPSIRTSQAMVDLDKVDEALNRTVEEIRGKVANRKSHLPSDEVPGSVGTASSSAPITRRGTVASSSSSAFPFRGRRQPQMRLNKELPPLPKQAPSGRSSSSDGDTYESARDSNDSSDEDGSTEESASVRNTSDSGNDLRVVKKAGSDPKLRKKTSIHKLDKAEASPESTPRPWNNPENYPWSEGTNTADVTLSSDPQDTTQTSEQKPKHRLHRSRSSPNLRRGGDTLRVIRSMSPGFDAELVPNSDVPATKSSEDRRRKGAWRSMSRKRAKTSQADSSEAHIDPHFFHPEEHRKSAVNPGDRYPSTALPNPPGLSIDESRSYFSDDSDDEEHRRHSRRRRFTRLRGKRSMPGISASPRDSADPSRSGFRRNENQDSMVFVDAPHAPADDAAMQERPPGGMSKAEFHAKRLVEKLRMLFFRSGEAFKHIGKSRRHDREAVENVPGV